MKKLTIKKDVAVNAPKERVWEVLLEPQFTNIWYDSFSPGSHADTDWQLGSKAIFTDNSGCGIFGTIVERKPYESVSIEYSGFIYNGVEDYESPQAQQMKGSRETYRLLEEGGQTRLFIECDMGEDYFESMGAAWEKALQKLKEMAEQPGQNK